MANQVLKYGLEFPLGAEGTPSISADGDSDTGLWFPTGDTIAVSTGGSERVRVDGSGHVGIGQTSPGTYTGGNVALVVGNTSGTNDIIIVSGTSNAGRFFFTDTADANVSGSMQYNHSGDYFAFGTSDGSERMRLDANGALLLGTATPKYSYPHLDIDAGGSNGGHILLRNANTNHQMTTLNDTDVGAQIGLNGTSGGLVLNAYAEGTRTMMFHVSATSSDNTRSTAANGAAYFDFGEKNGTDVHAFDANDNLLVITNRTTARWLVDADGDTHYDGTDGAGAWDIYDGEEGRPADIDLLNTFRYLTTEKNDRGFAKRIFGNFVEEYAQILHDTGVITVNDDGHHFVSTKGLNALMIDTQRQEAHKWRVRYAMLEERMELAEEQLKLLQEKN